jgi:ubiquinone/menaquinone biosynthesis C-methylase UbiE
MNLNFKIETLLDFEIDPGFKRRAKIITIKSAKLWRKSIKPVKILDIGCGRGWYENMLINVIDNCQVTAIDGNEEYLRQARKAVVSKSVNFVKGDATKLSFPNNHFDGIICSEVLEHITNDEQVIKEIRRVLRPGGTALISVPNKSYPFTWDPVNWVLEKSLRWHFPANIWWLAGIWADHVRLYSETELLRKFDKNDFKVVNVWRTTRFCLPFAHFLLYGIGKNIIEKGMFKNFNRFNFKKKPGMLFNVVKGIFDIWDRKNDKIDTIEGSPFLNLVLEVEKF